METKFIYGRSDDKERVFCFNQLLSLATERVGATILIAIGINGGIDFLQKIKTIIDHEGSLNVTWKINPTRKQMDSITEAWGICCEPSVYHFYEELVTTNLN